eukprot:UN03562
MVGIKRHNARFNPKNGNAEVSSRGKSTFNVKSGTVIDTQIVHKDLTEFYLQSQSSPLGTGRPSLYQVVFITQGVTLDDLQLLTNYLCWGSQRAAKATGLPAPLRYAYLLNTRSQHYRATNGNGRWMHENIVPELVGQSFFL